jgi:hypothetical protein
MNAAALSVLVLALALHAHASAQGGVQVEITGASADSVIDLAMNGGKVAEARIGSGGTGTSILDLANLGKQQVQVFVDRCQNGKIVRVQMVVVGNTLPEDEDCDRKPIGFFWAHRARRIVVDVGSGSLQVTNSGMSAGVKVALGAAAAGGVVAALAAGGGGSTSNGTPQTPAFTPSGTYASTTAVATDPGVHAATIALAQNLLLITALTDARAMTISGSSGSNWVAVSGTYDQTSRRATLTGTGTVAGRPNVGVRVEVSFSESGAVSGTAVFGTGGELPGGQSTTYSVQGQRQ